MKKLLLLLAFALSASSTVFAEEVQIDGLWYNLSETTAEVIMYKNNVYYSGDIVIPSSVSYNDREYSVTSIGNYAFQSCTGLTSVTIPNSVTSIGERAFYYCTGLTSVHITDLEAWCKISFGDGYSNPLFYAHHLYINWIKTTNLVIPNSVTKIGKYAFFCCTDLTSVTIPNSVTSIGRYAFRNCSGLTSITIPNSVTSIADSAFEGCSGLTSVTIGNSVTSIGGYAFAGCSRLTSVTIGNSVTSIGRETFNGCSGLTSITIPNSVTSIEDMTFFDCI